MLAFKLFPFIQAIVIIMCFILPLKKVSLKYRILLALIFGLGSLKQYIYIFSGGDMMDPKLTRYPAIFFDTIYFSSIFLFLLTLLRMLINGLYKLSRLNFSKLIIPAQSTRYAALFLLIACLIGGRAVFNGFAPPVDKFYEISVKNLPAEANDLRIVELADLHISAPTIPSEIEDIVERVNKNEPDLILIAGDFVDGSIEELDHMTKILFKLKAKYGVYAVSGNHELYSGYKEWIDYF
ncbi:MAG: metallophosphoesterase, partial [Succinivibrio dextrinosolvens]|nr:metallophosphoesterase [Succinivibrio dextrinosolvens]